MVDLSLMAASTYPAAPFLPEQSISKVSKDFQTFLPCPGTRKEISRSGSLNHHLILNPPRLEDPWKWMGWMLESDKYVKEPVLIDIQETRPGSVLFSFGVTEEYPRQQNILRFLMSGSSEAGRHGLDASLLSDLTGLDACQISPHLLQSFPIPDEVGLPDKYQFSLVYPRCELHLLKTPFVDIGNSACSFSTTALPDGRVPFTGIRPEMRDLLSIVEEFYPSKNSAEVKTNASCITRTETNEAWENIQASSSKLQSATVTPIKSPKKIKLNPSPKKRNCQKVGKERDLYRRSNFHACESLFSLILDKRQGSKSLLSLKNSDPDLPQLLTQFSAGIAGTGLAVLFSVLCKVSGGRVPFCTSKLLNTGFGVGLVWLSWAVNKLRDSIIHISKNANKIGVKDKDMIRRVDKSVNEMFFRAATVMVLAMLRFV